ALQRTTRPPNRQTSAAHCPVEAVTPEHGEPPPRAATRSAPLPGWAANLQERCTNAASQRPLTCWADEARRGEQPAWPLPRCPAAFPHGQPLPPAGVVRSQATPSSGAGEHRPQV